MSSAPEPRDSSPAESATNKRLDSWKEIAAHFDRGERTVRRWEQTEGLPVHRHQHEKRGTVYAYTAELDAWRAGRGRGLEEQAPPTVGRKHWRLVWGAALVVLLTIAGAVTWRLARTRSPTHGPMQVRPLTSHLGSERYPSLSPDGNQVAFSWNGELQDNVDIFVKAIGVETPRRITTDPAEDVSPAWSPDGRWIAFLRLMPKGTAEVVVIPVAGGFERKVGSARAWSLPSLAWSPDGKILAISDRNSLATPVGIVLFSIETGGRRRLTQPPAGSLFGDCNPVFRPDGLAVAFHRIRSPQAGDLHVVPVGVETGTSQEPKRLTFDERWIQGLDWTPDGRAIVFSSNRTGRQTLWKIPASGGSPEPLGVQADEAIQPTVARRGSRLAFERRLFDPNIWRISTTKGSPPKRLIASTHEEHYPQYSPDGKLIVFESSRSGTEEIWMCDREGSNPVPLTSMGSTAKTAHPRWSPDGRRIAFDSAPQGQRDIYLLTLNSGGAPRRLTTEPSHDVRPSWSRDGRWVYFGSKRTGRSEIFRVPAEGGAAVQVTRNGGHEAFESPDGKHLYYVTDKRPSGVWVVPVDGGEERQVLGAGQLGFWALANNGVYFVERPASGHTIEFFSFASRRREVVLSGPEGARFLTGMDVSPDGRWLLYSQLERMESDIMLVENFR